MRWIFYSLLAFNLGILLWYTQIQVGDEVMRVPPPQEGVKQLMLLSEQQETDRSSQESTVLVDIEASKTTLYPEEDSVPQIPEIEINGEIDAHVAESYPVCNTIGPFKQERRVDETEKRLRETGFITGRRSKTEQELFGYRVYLPSLGDKEAAKEAARELDKHDIRDYFIIHGEEDKLNGISLGLFRNKNGAIRRMAQVRRFGFQPIMEIRNREQTIYWLDIQADQGRLTDALWQEIVEGQPELQRLNRECAKEQE